MQDRIATIKLPLYGYGGTFAYTGTAGNSVDFPGSVSGCWVWCTTDAYVRCSEAATATVTDWPIPAFQLVWVPVPDPTTKNCRLSAIQIASGGSAYYCAGI